MTSSGTASAPELTDPLTGFGNRRKLVADLTEALRPTAAPTLFAIFHLGGYEDYVGLYGQVGADALIRRLARRFARVTSSKTCYRPRRDEFAVFLHVGLEGAQPTLDAALAALRKQDREQRTAAVSPAFGAALLPDEADDVPGVMMLTDERLALATRTRPPRERRRRAR